MKVKTSAILDDKNLLGHFVLHSIGEQFGFPKEEFSKIRREKFADVETSINGHDVSDQLQSLFDGWSDEFDRQVKIKAKELNDNVVSDFNDKLFELGETITRVHESIPEPWEDPAPVTDLEISKVENAVGLSTREWSKADPVELIFEILKLRR